MTSDANRLGEIVSWSLIDLLWGAAAMVLYSVVMLLLNWRLALLTMVVIPPLAVASLYFQKQILRAYREVRRLNSRITGAFNEGIMGATTTKILSREEKNLEEFAALTGTHRAASIKAATFSALFMPIVLVLSSVGTGLTLWRGGTGWPRVPSATVCWQPSSPTPHSFRAGAGDRQDLCGAADGPRGGGTGDGSFEHSAGNPGPSGAEKRVAPAAGSHPL